MYTREDADAFVEAWTTRDADSIVYFLRPVPPADEYVKVGVTTKGRLTNRVHDIQIGIPHDLEVEATISGDKRLEFQIHKYLKKAKKHKRGEWFELSRDDVQRVVAKFERRDK